MMGYPDRVLLYAWMVAPSTVEALRLWHASLQHTALLPVRKWLIPVDAPPRSGDFVAYLSETSEKAVVEGGIVEHGLEASTSFGGTQAEDVYDFRIGVPTGPRKGGAFQSAVPAVVNDYAGFCRATLSAGRLVSAGVDWVGSGAQCLPKLPLVGSRSNLLVTTREKIAASFVDVDAFLKCWDTMETYGDRLLLLRGMEAQNGAELLRAVQDKHWEMLRLAKPKLTWYAGPNLATDAEREAYFGTNERVLGTSAGSSRKSASRSPATCSPGSTFPAGRSRSSTSTSRRSSSPTALL